MRPSHGTVPSSSPPTAHSSSTMRPSIALVDDDVVDRDVPLAAAARPSSVGSSTTLVRRRRRRARARPRARRGRSTLRKPTRPKLTPTTGDARAEEARERAQHRAVAAEHDREVDAPVVAVRSSPCFSASSARRRARPRARRDGRAALTPARSARLAVRDDARRPPDRLSRRLRRSSGRCHRQARAPRWTRWTKNSRFPFGPGSPESTTPPTVARPSRRRRRDASQHAARCTAGSRTTPFGDVGRGRPRTAA